MFTIDTVVAALLIGVALGTFLGHVIGYGKGLRVSKARTLAHLRSIVGKTSKRGRRAPRSEERYATAAAQARRDEIREWAAWNA